MDSSVARCASSAAWCAGSPLGAVVDGLDVRGDRAHPLVHGFQRGPVRFQRGLMRFESPLGAVVDGLDVRGDRVHPLVHGFQRGPLRFQRDPVRFGSPLGAASTALMCSVIAACARSFLSSKCTNIRQISPMSTATSPALANTPCSTVTQSSYHTRG